MIEEELRHYVRWRPDPIELDRGRRYSNWGRFSKPSGLWLSVGDSWDRCARENGWPEYASGRPVPRVRLHPAARLAELRDAEGMRAFGDRFCGPGTMHSPYDHRSRYVDWGEVSAYYQGVAVLCWPDDWREYADWFSGWDCLSVCVWDLDAVSGVEFLGLNEDWADLRSEEEGVPA